VYIAYSKTGTSLSSNLSIKININLKKLKNKIIIKVWESVGKKCAEWEASSLTKNKK
jgi:hypothetical protein